MTVEVHWHEGLFLQPHHLQMMQRTLIARDAADRARIRPYPYGVLEARLSADALENERVQFDSLTLITPGGVVVDHPNSAMLPPLDIAEAFAATSRPLMIYLGVPLYYDGRANSVEGSGGADVKRMFRVTEVERADENSGDNTQPVQLRKVNARLMLETDDRTDMEVLPLLRITRSSGEDAGMPRQDPQFVPACMVLAGSPTLRELVRDLGNQIDATRKEVVNQLQKSGFSAETMKGLQIQSLMKLTALNRAAGRLPALAEAARAVTPFEAYLELRDCLGGLAAIHPEKDPFDAPAYNHDDPMMSFREIESKIRQFLKVQDKGSYLKLPFTPADGVLVADLADEHIDKPNEYFLAVRTSEDPTALARLVEDADEFKLMARSLVQTRIRGVRLKEERNPPIGLPTPVGLNYFRLLRAESQRTWDRIAQERRMALKFPGVDQGRFDEVTLYMTVPN